MAARKKTKQRKKPQYVRANKRKGESVTLARRVFTLTALLMIVIAILFGIQRGFAWIGYKLMAGNPRFEIQHLVISSDGKLTEDRIREYAELREGTNLFAVSFEDIEKNLVNVSIIESVSLERKLPNTLIIKVKERVPVARISGLQSKYHYLSDRNGFVLPYRRSAVTLPLIKGVDEDLRPGQLVDLPDVEIALKIIALCDSSPYVSKHVRIESLDVKYLDFIDMRLSENVRVRMPRFSLRPKLQNLATVIKISKDENRKVKEVDLTLDSAKVPVTYY